MRRTLFILALGYLCEAQTARIPGPGGVLAAGGGITEVGGGSQRTAGGSHAAATSATLAFAGNVSSGTLLVAGGTVFGSTGQPTSITLSGCSATWTTVIGTAQQNTVTFIARGTGQSAGACTVTVTPSGGSTNFDFSWSMDEFHGQNASPVDVDGGTTTGAITNGSTFAPADSITTVAANALVIAVMTHDDGAPTITAGTGFTMIGKNESNTSNQCHALEFQIVTTATSYSGAFSVTASNSTSNPGWAAQTFSFKP